MIRGSFSEPLFDRTNLIDMASEKKCYKAETENRSNEIAKKVMERSTPENSKINGKDSEIYKEDLDYGTVKREPFSSSWLEEYPQIVEHIESEHLLHVKGKDQQGKGLNWHEEKFNTDMEAQLNPEARVGEALRGGFQMKLGYFIVPANHVKSFEASSLSEQVRSSIEVRDEENRVTGYRFFVHPQAYDHFRALHEAKLQYVDASHSEFIGTPTSSYRSWVMRRLQKTGDEMRAAKGSVPFIIKLGVSGSVLGSDRWLTPNEIERSIGAQKAFDSIPKEYLKKKGDGADFMVIPETLGIALKGVKNYPPKVKESGLLIREFPQEFLKGECKIFSLAALMSVERIKNEHKGICGLSKGENEDAGLDQLPLIYEVIAATIRAKKVKSAEEFVSKYLIDGYLDAIEGVVLEEGLTIEPHSQNLCMVLNNDNTPKGFAYRDHGGIWIDVATRGLKGKEISIFTQGGSESARKIFKASGAIGKGYIASYSWFYRYQVFIKLMNLISRVQLNAIKSEPKGLPYQIGKSEKLSERNLQDYMITHLREKNGGTKALEIIENLSLSSNQYEEKLKQLDDSYRAKLERYFDLSKVEIAMKDGCFPAAEGGSEKERILYDHKGFLGKHQFKVISKGEKKDIKNFSDLQLKEFDKKAITSFEEVSLLQLKPSYCEQMKQGIAFFNESEELVGFMPCDHKVEL